MFWIPCNYSNRALAYVSKSGAKRQVSFHKDEDARRCNSMWPFFLTTTYEGTRTLRSSPKAVLNLLHDSERLFRLNPLVISVEKNSASPLSYTLIDDLPVFGHVKTKTTYTCTVQPLEDGVEHNIVAGLGTRSKNTFQVKKGPDDDVCELVQHTTTQVCPS